jgi:hypothetical protein
MTGHAETKPRRSLLAPILEKLRVGKSAREEQQESRRA